jgi:hypothetical protein
LLNSHDGTYHFNDCTKKDDTLRLRIDFYDSKYLLCVNISSLKIEGSSHSTNYGIAIVSILTINIGETNARFTVRVPLIIELTDGIENAAFSGIAAITKLRSKSFAAKQLAKNQPE